MNSRDNTTPLLRNALQFSISAKTIIIGIYFQEQKGLKRIPSSFFSTICKDKELIDRANEYVWIATQLEHADAPLSIELQKEPSLALWYYENMTYALLKDQFRITRRSFTGAFQYWVTREEKAKGLIIPFHKYSLYFNLRPDHQQIYISVTYDGESKVLLKDLESLVSKHQLDTHLLKSVIFEKQCQPYRWISEAVRLKQKEVYPILRREIAKTLEIEWEIASDKYKLRKAFEQIDAFYKTYLQNEALQQLFGTVLSWVRVKDSEMGLIKDRSKVLVFGQQQESSNAYTAFAQNGPFQLPPQRHYVVFIIYSPHEVEAKGLLENHLKGVKGFKSIQEYSHLPLVYHPELNIEINDLEDMEREIGVAINRLQKEKDLAYFAFYISPYSRYGDRLQDQLHYYRIKEILLKRRIVSQVIVGSKMKEQINYWIPNIAISMVAKLGGIPWKLARIGEKELIVGFGAFKSNLREKPYVGSAFCFDNEGHFQEFDCWQEAYEWSFVGSLSKAIRAYQAKNAGIQRLVIHYYKELNKKEFMQIEALIDRIQLSIPVIVVQINSSFRPKELIIDTQHEYKLPLNGSYYQLQYNDYLLYINDREQEDTKGIKMAGYPLKVSLQSNRAGLFEDKASRLVPIKISAVVKC